MGCADDTYDSATAFKLISVVSPVFNESEVIQQFHETIKQIINQQSQRFEIIYVNDGSRDDSLSKLHRIKESDASVSILSFSRNFGKESAISAGLKHARGDAVIIIDSDLQDPPELIPDMLHAWMLGAEVVNMRRTNRDCDSWLKRKTAKWFYRVMHRLSDIDIDLDIGDFRLLGRKAVDAINAMPERNRFMKGMFSWVGFKKVTIDYHRKSRAAGNSKWPYWRLWNFALDGITGFSTSPLKISSYLGIFFAFGSFMTGLFFFIKTLLFGDPVHGFPTLFLTMLFMGGIQLISIGIIGEYISRLFIEIKGRPLYLIDEYMPANVTTNTYPHHENNALKPSNHVLNA